MESPGLVKRMARSEESRPHSSARRHNAQREITLVGAKWMLGQQKTSPRSQAVLKTGLAKRRDK